MAVRATSGTGRAAFADESKARDYLLAATLLEPGDVGAARNLVRSLVLPGQHRLHMAKESDGRRRMILDAIASIPSSTTIHRAPKDGRSEVDRRAACLRALVIDLTRSGCSGLCLERDETLERRDRRQIIDTLHQQGAQLRHRHATAREEPLLALPDALASAWAKGGDWRRRVTHLVDCRTVAR
ncbi:hypothetical protein DEJ16_14295 [Curtobacterium sp. MCJR17_055]|nr:hypothetical protein DEI87_12755 [Curtobacterium sp. MCBD17_029]PYY53299.1 hypothetical protein DEJ16_14295 [Curtobacterium sp. MCJR17_055]PYY56453.1 hypothetical protein DEJ26_13535 [Curtobacterium sp. MCPF17_015]